MSNYQIKVFDSSTALGRSAIAVANCGDAEEAGCAMCGYVVAARDHRSEKIKSICTHLFWLLG